MELTEQEVGALNERFGPETVARARREVAFLRSLPSAPPNSRSTYQRVRFRCYLISQGLIDQLQALGAKWNAANIRGLATVVD